MKTLVISDAEATAQTLVESLKSAPGSGSQYSTLIRENGLLGLERVDLSKIDLIIIDSSKVHDEDLQVIAALTHAVDTAPAVIYLCENSSQEQLVKLIRAGASDVLHKPFNAHELIDGMVRIKGKRAGGQRHVSKVISFISCKGGAGATFLATNLGSVLATESEKKVLYIDLHMQGGDAAFYLLNTSGTSSLADIAKHSDLDSMMISAASVPIHSNYSLLQAPDSPEKTTGLNANHIDNLISVATKDYDYVIIDLPHTLDSITIKALDRSDMIFVVTQPIMTYLKAVTHLLHLFARLEYESSKVRVLLNRMDNVGVLSVARVQDSIQKNINLTIPNDFMSAVESVNLGVPISKAAPQSAITEALRTMAMELTGKAISIPEKKSIFNKLLRK